MRWPDTPDALPGALCPQTDPEVFFPEPGGSPAAAKRVCAACEARPDCLALALSLGNVMGVWGGLTEHERKRLKRTSPVTSQPTCRGCDKPFTPHDPRAIYCDDLCRQRARHQTKANYETRRKPRAA